MRYLANILTGANLVFGVSGILMAVDGHPVLAAWLIVLAGVMDAFDGKAARYFGGSSDFGLHFDSLADVISFGVAPSILAYTVAFRDLEWPGMFVCILPVLAAAFRLARFNLGADEHSHDYEGLASPAHAGLITTFVLMNYSLWGEIGNSNYFAGLMLISALLMVTRLPLAGLPRFSLRDTRANLLKLALIASAIGFTAWNPPRHAFFSLVFMLIFAFVNGFVRSRRALVEDGDEDDDAEPVPSHWKR
ncbi:CDP-alcohol phosphatidyltransferase family protein [bacterium]|nr:CDP-alcohol phosphatidyltransferase family protein [bacterium]